MLLAIPMVWILVGCDDGEPQPPIEPAEPVEPPQAEVEPVSLDAATAATNAFALDLLRTVEGDDLHLSPVSIAAAFSMVAYGARGETHAEMLRTLHLDEVPGNTAGGFAKLTRSSDGFKLSVINAVWAAEDLQIESDYEVNLQLNFGVGVIPLDFTDPEAAAERINSWVEQTTAERITDLVSPDSIDPDATRLMLTSAVYFNADWQQPFEKESTFDRPFATPGGAVDVPRMHQTARFGYAKLDAAAALRMPYEGDATMVVLLPDEGESLDAIIDQLDVSKLDAALVDQQVRVGIPKFQTRFNTSLIETMKSLGMTLPFAEGADFGGITTTETLRVGTAVHEMYIRVDEKGTQAAAATALGMEATSIPPMDMAEFIVDRPFAYLIRSADGVILFAGKVSDPRK